MIGTKEVVFHWVLGVLLGHACNALQAREAASARKLSSESAYVQAYGIAQVITRYRNEEGEPVRRPTALESSTQGKLREVPEDIWVKFGERTAHGHADKKKTVRCLLVHRRAGKMAYGVYGLRGGKSDLLMSLPFEEGSVDWPELTAKAALRRLLDGVKLDETHVRELLKANEKLWFAPGLRAFLIEESEDDQKQRVKIFVYEHIAK